METQVNQTVNINTADLLKSLNGEAKSEIGLMRAAVTLIISAFKLGIDSRKQGASVPQITLAICECVAKVRGVHVDDTAKKFRVTHKNELTDAEQLRLKQSNGAYSKAKQLTQIATADDAASARITAYLEKAGDNATQENILAAFADPAKEKASRQSDPAKGKDDTTDTNASAGKAGKPVVEKDARETFVLSLQNALAKIQQGDASPENGEIMQLILVVISKEFGDLEDLEDALASFKGSDSDSDSDNDGDESAPV